MIAELGHFSLILAFCLACAQSVISLVGMHRNYNSWMQAAKSIAVGYVCFLFVSLILLNKWNQSILIPLIILSGVTLVVALFAKQILKSKTEYLLSILGVINSIFLLFILTTANSFSNSISATSPRNNHSVIGLSFPSFNLASTTDDKTSVTQNDLLGKISLVNIWATWCVSCRVEHPQLLKLARDHKIFMVGINYKDDKHAAKKWLSELGNPYFFSVYDGDGKLSAQLGVSGAPETYIVDKQGIVRYKYVGVISEDIWKIKLKPEFDKWQQTN